MGPAGHVTRALLGSLVALLPLLAAADPAAWRLAGRNGGEVALLGSIHVLRDSDYPLPATVDALYARADDLVMELDLDDLDASVLQSGLLAASVLPPGKTLRDVLDPEVYRLTEQHVGAAGLPIAALERVEPWFIAIVLLDEGLRRQGFRADLGLEQYVLGKARKDRKAIAGLESLQAQVAIFDGLSAPTQQALLEQTLREIDSADRTLEELADAWRDGRLDELTDQLIGEFDDFPGLYDSLITDRNRRWVPEIERLLGDGRRHLVIVGAVHLVGKDGVIELLRARGHPAERVK
ncbi:MAG TPA: TraB/GumN family protein [Gammaproteobacteria bacterium]|nr:TraB/GumN family protein [Gammaproteobacteria bacterium]